MTVPLAAENSETNRPRQCTQPPHEVNDRNMKHVLFVAAFVMVFAGCNANPSKEARIRKLEGEITQMTSQLQELEDRVDKLEALDQEQGE